MKSQSLSMQSCADGKLGEFMQSLCTNFRHFQLSSLKKVVSNIFLNRFGSLGSVETLFFSI